MENKPSVEGILAKYTKWEGYGSNCTVTLSPRSIMDAMQEYASLLVAAKDKEIDGLKKENDWMKLMLAKTIKP